MSYLNAIKYVAPIAAALVIMLIAAWAFDLPPVSALNDRGVDPSSSSPNENGQFSASPYDLVQVSGTGSASGKPDLARLSLAVSVTQETVAAARTTAAQAMENVQTALADNGIDDVDIATSHFLIHPEYEYQEGTRVQVGYTVRNGISVTVRSIDTVGTIIDASVEAGGDHIVFNGLNFEISDPSDLERDARKDAVEDMQTKAEQMAEFSGRTLGDLKMVSESPIGPDLFAPVLAFAASASTREFDTPISTGENAVTVSVHGVYELRR